MDANMSDVIVVLDKEYEERLAEAVELLRAAGLAVEDTDDDKSVVTGSVDSSKVHDLKALPCVDYVRTVLSYDVNFPPGDPRDRDGM